MKHTIEEMVEGAMNILADASPLERKEFVESSFDELILYYGSLGRLIKNEFDLWSCKWTPHIINGVDESPNHPDAIAMSVIEALWKKLNPTKV